MRNANRLRKWEWKSGDCVFSATLEPSELMWWYEIMSPLVGTKPWRLGWNDEIMVWLWFGLPIVWFKLGTNIERALTYTYRLGVFMDRTRRPSLNPAHTSLAWVWTLYFTTQAGLGLFIWACLINRPGLGRLVESPSLVRPNHKINCRKREGWKISTRDVSFQKEEPNQLI